MCLLTAANSKHVSICVCYVRRDVWISAILSLLILAANLTLKYIIHVRIRLSFIFIPPSPPPAPSKHLKRVLSGDRKWQPCFKGQGYPISENSKKHYQVCMAFFFCFFFFLLIISFVVYNSGMYNNTHEPVLCLTCIEAWWPTWLLKIRQHFHWYPMCPLNLTKKALLAS